jgi:Domain of unknown function (DUF4249)
MRKIRLKFLFAFLGIVMFSNCIDPYSPKLKDYSSLLVVDGLITDANSSYTVKLSRTFQDQNTIPATVSDATVFVSDDAGNNFNLYNWGNGIYKTDSLQFTGIIGTAYTLHIITKEGYIYISDPCTMQPVPDIDSIYFASDQEFVNNNTESQLGIMIYLDSKAGNNNQYYRWDFDETWKFRVPDPKKYDYLMGGTVVPVNNVKEFCWKNNKSDEVLIRSVNPGEPGPIKKVPIFFIASNQSDRLMIEYSILVNQYSISKNEYEFWNNLQQVSTKGADIFASQPFSVIGNIHNINNSKEQVLGYFQVSAVKQKRMFIPFSEFAKMHLPFFLYDQCARIVKNPNDYPTGYGGTPPTLDDLYSLFCIRSNYYFIEPQYSSLSGAIEALVFTTPECADCELTGTSKKPDFWVDLN